MKKTKEVDRKGVKINETFLFEKGRSRRTYPVIIATAVQPASVSLTHNDVEMNSSSVLSYQSAVIVNRSYIMHHSWQEHWPRTWNRLTK